MALGLAGVSLGLAGCRSRLAGPGGAQLSVRVSGADSVTFSASPDAEWCDSLRTLQVRALAGDTGVALVLYPADSVEAGVYPIRQPGVADTTRRPSAAVALRWLSKTAVQGFQGESGAVTLTRAADGTLGGRFNGWGRRVPVAGRLKVAGSFDGVRLARAPAACAAAAPRDTTRAPEPDEGDDDTSGVD